MYVLYYNTYLYEVEHRIINNGLTQFNESAFYNKKND